ncbi:MAG TPA: glycosyltransferase [Paludibacter sp.]|nr:MAG: putative glycosyltransferase EpsH [Bacteroidetes bacterium ADurb.Bin174]HQB29091.1 glycosyltransferase [Paludibacter sp.]
MLFSIIIPVYNRPDEVKELLESLTKQTDKKFEVMVVEDGSTLTCEDVCKQYAGELDIKYLFKENSGPGGSRNYGAEQAKGDYLLILDSDCIIPEHYIQNIRKELKTKPCDAFGGPDAAHENFSDMQKAVNYAMTSLITTGGIRGGKKDGLEKFHPRSFNMGVKTDVYRSLGGFSNMRYGEDIDFSIRIFKAGYTVRLFPEAYVYHKRRVNLAKFYRQVFHSGAARIALWKKHPESLKLVHFLPSIFVIGMISILIAGLFNPIIWGLLLLFCLIVFVDSSIQNKSIKIGLLSIVTSFTQLFGYGLGFLSRLK